MKKILAFAGSNSSESINQKFVEFAASQITDFEVKILNLRDFEMPIYAFDYEENQGIPEKTIELHKQISGYDNLMISVNEHNGGLSAFFKNCMDWLSRHDRDFLKGKKLFILSTSPGRGAANMANDYAVKILPRFGAEIISSFALASFNHSFDAEHGITDEAQKEDFNKALNRFTQEIK